MAREGLPRGAAAVGRHLDAHGFEVLLILEFPHAPAGRKKRLAGHAPAVHTGAADVVPLDHRHLQPLQKCGPWQPCLRQRLFDPIQA